ncbi:TRAM domain-containing protein [Candidatus Saccharibacteria bacterium]|nr:TRAM domain-containing protein [Candidatus Saccharibacteria bacterium]
MELFIFIVVLTILLETTYITAKTISKPIINSSQKRKVYIDTSALIDGRIVSVAKVGFLGDDLIIPRSVIRELQLLADGKDNEKRSRARFGLDNINELERVELATVTIYDDKLDRTPVDDRLIDLAKENRGLILTNDYNLNMAATAEGIDILNVNDLALAVRQEYLPGETFTLKITGTGSNPKQGVGHLPDGTMVVVDNASTKVNKEVKVEFIRFLQTSSGRMMFAKIIKERKSRK